jgi:hypothetical protein
MADRIEIYFGPDGETVQAIYSDDLMEVVAALGADVEDAHVARASHVEPHPMASGRGWIVDMRPVGGAIYGVRGRSETLSPPDVDAVVGFARREDALAFEVAYLRRRMERGVVEVSR